ncbi:MAG: DUF3667 domain-containing protein [Sphingomonas sp.]
MSGELAAAGDIVTGGLAAHAVEGAGSSSPTSMADRATCLNCGTALVGSHCHACGQQAHVHKTLASIGHDLLHGVFHFEGRIWTTLPMLFTRPGQLTRRYIAGERVKFVSPLALFLFSVFLMVATFESVGGPIVPNVTTTSNGQKMLPAKAKAELAKKQAELVGLVAERAALMAKGGDTEAIDDKISSAADEIDGMRAAVSIALGDTGDTIRLLRNKVHTRLHWLDERINAAAAEPALFLYKLQSSAYKFSWLLIPISLPFIWLLFAFRRDVGPYDHAIFAIYSLSAMTMGVVGLSVLRAIGLPGGTVNTMLVLGPPLHMYKQLRGAYGVTRFGAAWRTVALLVSSTVAGGLFIVAVLGVVH